MINILRMQEILKGVPEEALIKEMQNPTGAAPLFLVASRLQEVKKLKEQYALEQQQADTTVAEDLVGAQPGQPVAGPVSGARPTATMSPPPPGGPLPAGPSPVGPSPVAGLPPPPPVRMESGGRIGYEKGGDINIDKAQFEKFLKLVQAEARDPETQKAVASVILNRLTVGGGEFGDTLEEVMLKSGAFEPIGNIIKENRGKMNWNALEAPSEITRANITKWFNEGSKDSTDGALFFINKQLTDERETTHPIFENWDESMRLPDGTKRIGKMLFSNRFEVNDKIDRVEAARAAGEPTITVAGVVTPQPSVEITSPSFPPPFIDPDKMPDLMAQSLAAVKAPEGLKSEPVVDSDFNITPVDAVLGEPIDPLLVDDGTIPDSGFGVPPGLVEAAGTAQGLPTTSWLEGYKRLISPGIGKGEDFGRLTPVADNLTAEARALIENAGVDPTIPSATAGVTTGEPKYGAQGQLLSGLSGPKTGQDVRTYTAPFTPAIAAYEPLPDDPGFNVMDPTTKREGLSPYNMAGMLKEARDQVGREERQVAEADIIQGAEIDPMNLMPPRGQVVPSQEARNVLALQNEVLTGDGTGASDQVAQALPPIGMLNLRTPDSLKPAHMQNRMLTNQLAEASEMLTNEASNVPVQSGQVIPPVSTDQLALEQRVAGPFSYMQNPFPSLVNPVSSRNELLLAGNGGTPGEGEGVGEAEEVVFDPDDPEFKGYGWYAKFGNPAEQAAALKILGLGGSLNVGENMPAYIAKVQDALANASISKTNVRSPSEQVANVRQQELDRRQQELDRIQGENIALAQGGGGSPSLSTLAGLSSDTLDPSSAVANDGSSFIKAIEEADWSSADESGGRDPLFTRPGAGLPVYNPVSEKGTTDARDGASYEDNYLSGLEKSRDEAKGLGLLMAGLGMMGQASKPGATLGSSLPGAAAGVKTYMESSKDIRKTALEREKMRRLAEYQGKTLDTKTLPYIRKNMMAAYWKDLGKRALYFDEDATTPEGNTNVRFEKEIIELSRKPDAMASFMAQKNREATRKLWQQNTGDDLARAIRRELKDNDKMSRSEKTRYIMQKVNEAFEKHLLDTGGPPPRGGGGNLTLEAIYNKTK